MQQRTLRAARRCRFRSGFTLVELLVVIAIIGVLVALLLPAVQAAREAARRVQCQSNLKQLALGVLNYESSKKTLPPGGITDGDCCGTQSGAGWSILILPFVEQQSLYSKYDFDEPNEALIDTDKDGLVNSVVREANPVIFDCPTDEDTELNDRPASGPGETRLYNRGSYRGNSGLCTTQSQAYWDSSSQGNEKFAHERGPLPGIGRMFNNPWVLNPTLMTNPPWTLKSPVALREIVDGTTNTLLLAEKSHTGKLAESLRRRTFWAYTYTSYQRSVTFLQTRSIISDYDRCLAIGGDFGDDPCKRSWGSLHPGGLTTAMCDGSVAFVSEGIDIFLFGGMSTIAGGENLPAQ
jgi:prepilin-type N-terminal cleavage/methylation domain-containing protein/prepilin-type processing-associated H-X9-DG protein